MLPWEGRSIAWLRRGVIHRAPDNGLLPIPTEGTFTVGGCRTTAPGRDLLDCPAGRAILFVPDESAWLDPAQLLPAGTNDQSNKQKRLEQRARSPWTKNLPGQMERQPPELESYGDPP